MSEIAADFARSDGSLARFRGRLRRLVEKPRFERFIMGIIVLNAVTLGMQTSGKVMAAIGEDLDRLDNIILGIFVIELMFRMFAYGGRFWRDPWSLFDTLVVGIALVPATGNLSVLRALRVIRALRLISAFPAMRRVVNGLVQAIPGMSSVVLLLLLIFYVFSVMATKMFGAAFPAWFGTIGESTFTLFQIMTLEGWSDGKVRPVMEVYSWAWAFFVPFILITSFAVLNLFIGIIVEAMQGEQTAATKATKAADDAAGEADRREVREVLREVRGIRLELLGPETSRDVPPASARTAASAGSRRLPQPPTMPPRPRRHRIRKRGRG